MPAVSKQLLSMLDGLRSEAQLTERLKVLSEREKTIRGWLAEERAEQEKLDKVPSEFPAAGGTPLSIALSGACGRQGKEIERVSGIC